MLNTNHNLRFFGLFFGLLFVLAFGACEKEDNTPNTLLSNGSFVELEFNGKKYKADGLGGFMLTDTTIVFGSEKISQKYVFGTVGTSKWVNSSQSNAPILVADKIFSFTILNYDGKGTYNRIDYDKRELSGVVWITYSEGALLGEYFSINNSRGDRDEKRIEIKIDNDKEISGTFSFLAQTDGRPGDSHCTGKFKIVKK